MLYQVAIWEEKWVETDEKTADGYYDQTVLFALQPVFANCAMDAKIKAILKASLSEKQVEDCSFVCEVMKDESYDK